MLKNLKRRLQQLPDLTLQTEPVNLKQVLIHILVCLAEVVLVIGLIPLLYESNDDPLMNQIASGNLSGEASPFLMFTHIYIGHFLNWLFEFNAQINWYTWYLLATFWLGYTAVQVSLFRVSGTFWSKSVRHLVVLLFFLPSLFLLQFTRIAAIACAGGLMLILSAGKSRMLYSLLLGGLLVLLGCMVRYQVFHMYLFLSAPFFVWLILKRCWLKVSFTSVLFFIAFIVMDINGAAYQNNDDFEDYRTFNRLRSAVTTADSPMFVYDAKKEIADSLGWTENDFLVASDFMIDVGHPKFKKEHLAALTDKDTESASLILTVKLWLRHSFNTLVNILERMSTPYLLLTYIMVILTWVTGKRFVWWWHLGYFIYTCGLALAMAILTNGNLKSWVAFGMFLPLLIFSAAYIQPDRIVGRLKINWSFLSHRNIINLIVATCFFLAIGSYVFVMPEAINDRIKRDSLVYEAVMEQNDPFWINWIAVHHYPALKPSYDFSNSYLLGWFAGSPWNKDKIEKYTGNRNAGAYTIFNRDIPWYFRSGADIDKNNRPQLVKQFYRENYPNSTVEYEVIPVLPTDTLHRYTFFIPLDTLQP